jgi:ABC-2 type transport system ATP-binding protein
MTALETTRLGRRYRRTWALRDCSVTVPAGRVVALVGPNGAGKTTLLHLAVGMLSPSEGEVRVFGRPVRESMERVAFMAQGRHVHL